MFQVDAQQRGHRAQHCLVGFQYLVMRRWRKERVVVDWKRGVVKFLKERDEFQLVEEFWTEEKRGGKLVGWVQGHGQEAVLQTEVLQGPGR